MDHWALLGHCASSAHWSVRGLVFILVDITKATLSGIKRLVGVPWQLSWLIYISTYVGAKLEGLLCLL